jgi:hypothetical protein
MIDGEVEPLLPFSTEFGDWLSATPQGAQEVLVPFEYVGGVEAAAVSRTRYGEGEAVFLGLNLMFHAAITGDPTAIRLLESLTGMTAGLPPDDQPIPLEGYAAGEDGWRFDITLPREEWVLFPMAHHDGTRVLSNGAPVESVGIETLTLARLPEGASAVHITSTETGVYSAGRIGTALGVLVLLGYVAGGGRLRLPRSLRRPQEDRASEGAPLYE